MCRDAEDDLHSIYRKYQSQAQAFYAELREKRGSFPGSEKPALKAETSVAADGAPNERKWLSYLDDGIIMQQPLPSNPNGVSQSIFSTRRPDHEQVNPLLYAVLGKREQEATKQVKQLLEHLLGEDLFTTFLQQSLPDAASEV